MVTYKTPGVYVEEIPTLPPSVAEVATAVPAFIGYTEKGSGRIERIDTLLDYETIFGGPKPSQFQAVTRTDTGSGLTELVEVRPVSDTEAPEFLMYYCLSLYFKNGGGSCYVVSVGDYSASPAKENLQSGLVELEKEDEPTLILLTDAINLLADDYYALCQEALLQCNKLGDRFCIFDIKAGDDEISAFRNGIGNNYLMYGAAYYPYLRTSLTHQYQEDAVSILQQGGGEEDQVTWRRAFDGENGLNISFTGAAGDTPAVRIVAAGDTTTFAIAGRVLTISGISSSTGTDVDTAWDAWVSGGEDPAGFDVAANGDGSASISHTSNSNVNLDEQPGGTSGTMASIKTSNTALYNQIRTALSQQRVILPSSSAVAGIYASVDRNRGVWKAPANVSLASVIGPVTKITDDAQESLNVDPTAGKSVNAIRAFTGKGTLIWGARTLAGNDNEWRYVPVRRMFNMIEESSKKATSFAVFEPNNATTWLKVKAMIESYLYGLWEQGAFMGSTPDAAYYVNVGLGKTMTAQDVLEGRMIVEIGIAAVRPAEFIILRFMHKLPEA